MRRSIQDQRSGESREGDIGTPMEDSIRAGDMAALRALYQDDPLFPNVTDSRGTTLLIAATHHGPLALVRQLLDAGADTNADVIDGFPTLFAAIDRQANDRHTVIELLLAAGADVQQRGINDYTALHYAACRGDGRAVAILLEHGADPSARTRIDHYATPLEEAVRFGHPQGVEVLRNQRVQTALRWIADIFRTRSIPFQIVGGLAARAYGATRQIADMDLYAPASGLTSVLDELEPFVTRPLARHRDQHWDLIFMRLEYTGQAIEIAVGDDAKYRDSLGAWHDAAIDYAASERIDVLGVNVPVIPRSQLLSYKRRLDRTVDRADVQQISQG